MSGGTLTAGGHARDPFPDASRYECLLRIASGGMATVYVARQRGTKGFTRLVAVKRAHAHLLDDDNLRRTLIEEARVASQLHHPNVASVLDVEELEGELLLVMPYVEGAALSQLLVAAEKRAAASSDPEARARKGLPVEVVVKILLDATAGLAAMHELTDAFDQALGLVHRDVSPQNVLVGVDGSSRIADFGIAKGRDSSSATQAGELKGKFGYMAPEYVGAQQADARADIFGLGVVLWESLTGGRLFRGNTEVETIHRIAFFDPPPISSAVPGLHPAFDPVVAKTLSKKPDARYATASEFRRDLQAAAEQAGISLSAESVSAAVRELVGDVLGTRRKILEEILGPEAPSRRARRASLAGADPNPAPAESPATNGVDGATLAAAQPALDPPFEAGNTPSLDDEPVLGVTSPYPEQADPAAPSEERIDTGSTKSALVGDLLGGERLDVDEEILSRPLRASRFAVGGAIAALAAVVVVWVVTSSGPVPPSSSVSSNALGPAVALSVSTPLRPAASSASAVARSVASATASASASSASSGSAAPSASAAPKLGPALVPAGPGKGTTPRGSSRLGY
jgi:serine/threonine protein kinase